MKRSTIMTVYVFTIYFTAVAKKSFLFFFFFFFEFHAFDSSWVRSPLFTMIVLTMTLFPYFRTYLFTFFIDFFFFSAASSMGHR